MTLKKILIVDDSEFDRELFKKALSRLGDYEAVEAESGEKCLDVLAREQIDLVLLDIMMPGVFGTEVLLRIREKFNALLLPVIMVTAKADASDLVNCLRSGANDYITKPVHFEVAHFRIRTHLELAEVSQEMARLKQIAGLNAVIATYNHEINTPLSIAIGCLDAPDMKSAANHARLERSLWRVAEIVKKIRTVTQSGELELEEYVGAEKMLKLK